jgi:hypothetical protein
MPDLDVGHSCGQRALPNGAALKYLKTLTYKQKAKGASALEPTDASPLAFRLLLA